MKVGGTAYRTVWMPREARVVRIIDQRKLPWAFELEDLRTVEDVAEAISAMHVRGAGCIGATAAAGMWLAADQGRDLEQAGALLRATRPTAVNLAWAVDRMLQAGGSRQEAEQIAEEDVEACRAIGRHGLRLLEELAAGRSGPVRVLTHCNAGWLAFVDIGSATAPIYAAQEAGLPVHVWVDETRPRNQGARLTAWELAQQGVPHTVICDNAGAHLMQRGEVDVVLTGADRVTRRGDVANKIGTRLKALAARDSGVPFCVALPSSTIDWTLSEGTGIPIEERDAGEVIWMEGPDRAGRLSEVRVVPEGSPVSNFAFDVTPARLVDALITEAGVAASSAGLERELARLHPAAATATPKAQANGGWRQDLLALLGEGRVSLDADELRRHSGDKWFASALPEAVAFPESTADVAAVLRLAHQARVPVTTRGAGVGYVGGCVPSRGGIVLSLSRMNRILEISPADGVAVVEPGVVTGTLQDEVRRLGWFYPPDPASLRECSLGGNIATNAGGPRCLKYGVTRHYVLGLEAVLMDGTVVRAGSRCHKNKTGFDLVGLFVGSEGMLGVVTQATLRLIPHPPARAALAVTFPDFAAAAAAVERIFAAGFLPSALEISDSFTLEAARRRLGADALPPGDALLLVEVDGQPDSVRVELRQLQALAAGWQALAVQTAETEDEVARLWAQRREFSYSLRDTGLTKLNEDVVVPRGRLVELVAFCRSLQQETGIAIACFGHAGDGNIHVNLMVAGLELPEVRARASAALDQLFAFVIRLGGAITGEHGVGLAKGRWFAQAVGPGALDLHRRLKRALDPLNLLNPGKFLDVAPADALEREGPEEPPSAGNCPPGGAASVCLP